MTDASLNGQSITASVEVEGLPKNCVRLASETAGIEFTGHVYPVDEFGELPKNDQRGRVDLFLQELRDHSTNNGFVDIYHKDKKRAEAILRLYVSHVRFRKFDLSRLTFRLGVDDDVRTVLWVNPPGFDPWVCDTCTTIRGKDLK